MQPLKNEQGYALVFMTLMIVLLLIMVGMGLDTGHLAYVRSQGQPAVDAAALAAASAIPSGNWSTVTDRAAKFNPGGTNPGTGNNYLDSPNNQISQKNVTLVKYDNATGGFTTSGVNINNANGARDDLGGRRDDPHHRDDQEQAVAAVGRRLRVEGPARGDVRAERRDAERDDRQDHDEDDEPPRQSVEWIALVERAPQDADQARDDERRRRTPSRGRSRRPPRIRAAPSDPARHRVPPRSS